MGEKLKMNEKFTLTIGEAADYFGIGVKRMRRLAEAYLGTISIYNGNRYLIIRTEFETYLRSNPIIKNFEEEKMRRAELETKSTFIPEEAIEFYELSGRKFKRLLEEDDDLPFIAYFRKRKLIIRDEFEKYMEENPGIKEGLKSGKTNSF